MRACFKSESLGDIVAHKLRNPSRPGTFVIALYLGQQALQRLRPKRTIVRLIASYLAEQTGKVAARSISAQCRDRRTRAGRISCGIIHFGYGAGDKPILRSIVAVLAIILQIFRRLNKTIFAMQESSINAFEQSIPHSYAL